MMRSVQRFRLDRIPDNLLREPLSFLIADHVRQRKVCIALDTLVGESSGDRANAVSEAISSYLSEELPLHISDEELDLFPSLLAACEIEDDAANLIDALIRDHAMELSLAWDVVKMLQKQPLPPSEEVDTANFAQCLSTFTQCVRRHLAIEEETLLPLARKRLSAAELEQIGRAMARRRKIDYPV